MPRDWQTTIRQLRYKAARTENQAERDALNDKADELETTYGVAHQQRPRAPFDPFKMTQARSGNLYDDPAFTSWLVTDLEEQRTSFVPPAGARNAAKSEQYAVWLDDLYDENETWGTTDKDG